MRKIRVLLGVSVILFGGVGLTRVFGEQWQGLWFVLSCVLATVVMSLLPQPSEERLATTITFGLITACVLIYVVGWQSVVGSVAGLLIVAAVGAWFWFFERHRLGGRKLVGRAAPLLGWQASKPDDALLKRVRLILPEVTKRRRALYAAMEGVVDGVPLTLVTGRLAEQVWLCRLPFALPSVPLYGTDDSAPDPGAERVRQALLTPQVQTMAQAGGVKQWRIERDDLLLQLPAVNDPGALASRAREVAALLRALPIDGARQFAVDPGTVPSRTVVVAEPWHSAVNTGAGVAVLVGIPLLACGGWNAFNPEHLTGAQVMLGIGGGAVVLALLASIVFGRKATRSS